MIEIELRSNGKLADVKVATINMEFVIDVADIDGEIPQDILDMFTGLIGDMIEHNENLK